jgi:hypothetical protein
MLRILGRGHSVPTVTELIFVRAQRFTNFAIKAIYALDPRNFAIKAIYALDPRKLFLDPRKLLLWQSW